MDGPETFEIHVDWCRWALPLLVGISPYYGKEGYTEIVIAVGPVGMSFLLRLR